jgi:hypothetical protein
VAWGGHHEPPDEPRYTIYSPVPVKAVTHGHGHALPFTSSSDARLTHLSVTHEEGDRFEVSF